MDRARLDTLVNSTIDRAASARDRIHRSRLVLQRASVTIADAMHRHPRLRTRHPWSPIISGGSHEGDDGRTRIARPVRGALAGVRVLLVEDNTDVRELFETAFDYCGASVVVAETGRSAFRVFQDASPHVVVTDISMPDWTGYRLLRQIRALPAERGGDTPVIAVTAAYSERRDRERAMEAGFSAWVTKPASVSALVTLVEDVTAGRPRSAPSRTGRTPMSEGGT